MRRIWECPVLAAGEEIDCAIEHYESLVEMTLDLGDIEWAAQAGKVLRLLRHLREAGLGRGDGDLTKLPVPASLNEE